MVHIFLLSGYGITVTV